MFIEMIKSEFKQLQGPFKLALVLIAIMTGSIFLIVHFIFLILGVESTGAIILWYLLYGIVNMFLQFLYPVLTFGLYVFGGYIFYRNMYSTNTVSANKLILSKFIPMVIFQIVVRVALLLSTERILGGFDALRYGYGYGISFGDIVSYSEFAFFDIYNHCTTIGIFAATLLLWLCVSIEKLFKKSCGVFGIILFFGICLLLSAEQFTETIIMRVIRSYPKELLDNRLTEIHCHVRTMASIIKNVVLVILYYCQNRIEKKK